MSQIRSAVHFARKVVRLEFLFSRVESQEEIHHLASRMRRKNGIRNWRYTRTKMRVNLTETAMFRYLPSLPSCLVPGRVDTHDVVRREDVLHNQQHSNEDRHIIVETEGLIDGDVSVERSKDHEAEQHVNVHCKRIGTSLISRQ